MGCEGISRLVRAWHERSRKQTVSMQLSKLWAEGVKHEWIEDCGKRTEKGNHKLQGGWPKRWVRKPSKVLGAAEWYKESRWWSLRRRVQMALVVRRQCGVKNSPSSATPGGERLEHAPYAGWAWWLIWPPMWHLMVVPGGKMWEAVWFSMISLGG